MKLISQLVEFLQAILSCPVKSGDFRWSQALVGSLLTFYENNLWDALNNSSTNSFLFS